MRVRTLQPVGQDFSVYLQCAADKKLRHTCAGTPVGGTGSGAAAQEGWIGDGIIGATADRKCRTHSSATTVTAATTGREGIWIVRRPACAAARTAATHIAFSIDIQCAPGQHQHIVADRQAE